MSKLNKIITSIVLTSAIFMSVCICKINDAYDYQDNANLNYIAEKDNLRQESIKDTLTNESNSNTNTSDPEKLTSFYSILNRASTYDKNVPYSKMNISNGDLKINFTVKDIPMYGDLNGNVSSTLNVEQIKNQDRKYAYMEFYGDIYEIVKPFFNNQFYCIQYMDPPVYYVLGSNNKADLAVTEGKFDTMSADTYYSTYDSNLNSICDYIDEETTKSQQLYILNNGYTAIVSLNTEKEHNEDNSIKSATSAYAKQISSLLDSNLVSAVNYANINFNFTSDYKFDTIEYDIGITLYYSLFGLATPMDISLKFKSTFSYSEKYSNKYDFTVKI